MKNDEIFMLFQFGIAGVAAYVLSLIIGDSPLKGFLYIIIIICFLMELLLIVAVYYSKKEKRNKPSKSG